RAPAESREARRLYLSGRHLWNKRQPDELKKALSLFRRALDEDASYAPAYAGLADCYDTLTGMGAFAPDEGYPKAKAAALRALGLDEGLAEAHASLGHVHMRYDWDWAAAEREYMRAVELNPSYAPARHWLSIFMTITGRHDEAIAEGERARQLDPLSPMISLFQGAHLYFARRFEESLARCRRVLEAEPDFVAAHCFTGQALSRCGRHEEAVGVGLTAHRLSGGSTATLSALCNYYAVAGRTGEARAALAELSARARDEYVNPFELATAHVALNDERTALDCLERAHQDRVGDIIFLGVAPEFDGLRHHPRFRRLLARLKLPKSPALGRRLSAVS
ncbi:MAG TPA: tetratricopeptide repeat protein, partial [Pyrinomonadaceae bacterium]